MCILDLTEDNEIEADKMMETEAVKKLDKYLEHSETELRMGPVPFQIPDPLGSSVVPSVTQEQGNNSQYQVRNLGQQASALKSPQDRIIAMWHLNTVTHILLCRSLILKSLALLISNSNTVNLIKHLEVIGLSDMRKIVKLMTLTATNRVEVSNVQNPVDQGHLPFSLNKHFLQLTTQVPLAASYCLNNLSIAIAALAENDAESSKLVVDMCTKDLIMIATGVCASKNGFAVTQALINILSIHGGSSLMHAAQEDLTLSPVLEHGMQKPLTLVNALSAYIVSSNVPYKNREWATQQLFKCISSRIQMTNTPSFEQINFADLSNSLPACKMVSLEGHDNRVAGLTWHEDSQMLASAGYDGTVRIWSFDKSELYLHRTLIFHSLPDVYGSDLQGKHIGHLKWSSSGEYIAAAMENVVNIWYLGRTTEASTLNSGCFIDNQNEFITAMTWPSLKPREDCSKNYLIVGKIDGSVSLISVHKDQKEVVPLANCSMTHGKSIL